MKASILLLGLGACAWQDGKPMGSVVVTLEARWTALPDRDVGDGWQRLASDFEIQVDAASVELGALALIDVGIAASDFDPANPPAGYSLCHSGHCHADDGRLVPYEEIAAELSGGAPPAPVLELPVGSRALTPGGAVVLDCDGPCDLPRATIGRVEITMPRLAVAGRVRDGREPPRLDGEVAWTLTLDRGQAAPAVLGRIELPVDRGHDPAIALTVTLAPGATLFDEVRFAEAAGLEVWAIDEDDASRAAVEDALVELALALAATRRGS